MEGRFRFEPPAPQEGWLDRPRLARRLRRRFEVPVVVVTAPAGYGKTTALTQALADPDRLGRDLWLQCEASDADPTSFASAVLRSGGIGEASGAVDAVRLVGMLARFAPDPVCLVLDDTHRIPSASPTWRLLDDLLTVLPHNAHLLISGRVAPPLALARLEVAGGVELLTTRDLEFDDTEMAVRWDGVAEGEPAALGDAARWPAVTALAGQRGAAQPASFLVEEVVAGWPPERFAALAALAHLNDIEDEDAQAVAGVSAVDLLADLPLVQRSPDATFQLHDLWRSALTDPETWQRSGAPELVRAALSRVAARLLAEGRSVAASALAVAAGDREGFRAAALHFAAQPFMVLAASDVELVADRARSMEGEHLVVELLAMASLVVQGGETTAAEGLEALADRAARAGDGAVEALAVQQAINMRSILDPDRIPPHLTERAQALAPTQPAAQIAATMATFHAARSTGRTEDAMAVLQQLSPPKTARELVTYCFGMTDLGRPEQIDAVYSPDDVMAAEVPSVELAVGIWLRGGVTPETALEYGTILVDGADDGGFPHIEVSTNATFALIALTAGDGAAARRFADAALRRCGKTASRPIQAFAQLVDALCTLCERGEEPAGPQVRAVLEQVPIERWPARPYLFALPSVYVLAPEVREALDACRFGESLTAALDAGRALVALREAGDPGPARRLAWDRPDLLRVHVLPPHLAELAAAAAAAGSGRAAAMAAALPDARRHLAGVAERRRHAATADWAEVRVRTMPERPPDHLEVDLLGPLVMRRGGAPVLDPTWAKRDRVRELLAYLAVHRRARRRAVAAALWPDFDPDKAGANLRVNLTHLQKVLQPERAADAPPWFVQADAEWLELVRDGVAIDIEAFEELLSSARRLDEEGRARPALEGYLEALERWRGDLADDWPNAAWAEMERLRLRTLSIGARCRAGELQVALGEPEAAARTATTVLSEEPLQERAARLLASAAAAQSDRATARRVVVELLDRLAEAGLDPEPETVKLAQLHGVRGR